MSERATIRMIVGLGNPGPEYARRGTTPASGWRTCWRNGTAAFSAPSASSTPSWRRSRIEGADVLLLKPQTFMNRSGASVQAASAYLKIPVEQILVAHDELDLPPGRRAPQAGRRPRRAQRPAQPDRPPWPGSGGCASASGIRATAPR
jgi:peptidyl-tRNA hydrolase, PTH1 family